MTPVPFLVDVPQPKLDAIRAKLEAAWISYAPDDDADWKYGTDAAYLTEFRDYWLNTYDWRAAEKALNAFPQFKVQIEDVDVHFYHVKGSGSAPFPIILTHGWPGSVVEFLDVIDRLANPGKYGGDPEQGFDIVVPSLPGYGFSGRPPRPIGPIRVAALWRILMTDVLGYKRFGAQGGDWGSGVTIAMARDHADVVASIHINIIFHLADADGDDAFKAWQAEMGKILAKESAYMHEHATKPQTIALALSDSPIGFAAWVLEKCRTWGDTHGDIESSFTKDQLITNIMTYLVNDAVGSAIWMYNGTRGEKHSAARIELPVGFASFPGEFVPPPPRNAAEKVLNIVRWTEMPAGGHFAAWEQPEAFADEVRTYFLAHR